MSLILSGSDGLSDIDGSASTPAIRGTDANSGVFFGVNTVSISTDGTAAVTVDSGQRTKFPTTIGVGGATPSTSGSGVSFPATASASSDANTLDDYEEGTWTVTLFDASSGGNASSTTTTGYYTKVGNLVTCSFGILANISTAGMTSGNTLYVSLPFTPVQASSGTLLLEFVTYATSRTESAARVNASAARAILAQAGSGQSVSALTVAALTSGTSDIDRFVMSFFV
jgi:hypothetical protein